MTKRLTVLFSGTVQGVGFRFTAERIARRLAVTGFVKNSPTGKVELVAEGEEESLTELLNGIKDSHVGLFIREAQACWSEPTGEFKSFRIVV